MFFKIVSIDQAFENSILLTLEQNYKELKEFEPKMSSAEKERWDFGKISMRHYIDIRKLGFAHAIWCWIVGHNEWAGNVFVRKAEPDILVELNSFAKNQDIRHEKMMNQNFNDWLQNLVENKDK